MLIDGIHIDHSLGEILGELQSQLHAQGIPLLNKTLETPSDIMVTCPYHKGGQEKKPSAGIRKSDGLFHCLACGETHSLPEMISNCFGYSDPMVGWTWLRNHFISVSVSERKPLELDLERNVSKFVTEYVSESELDGYRYLHPYMYQRGLKDQIIELFDIGFDRDFVMEIKDRDGNVIKHKHIGGCITFPVRDEKGNVLLIARRSVVTKWFNYPSQSTKPLYGLYEYETHKNDPEFSTFDRNTVVVCESMLDALVVWGWGMFAVALNGLGTDLQFKQLSQMSCRKLILATDNDERGRAARTTICRGVRGKLVTQFDYSTYPVGKKDMNDLTEEEFKSLREVF